MRKNVHGPNYIPCKCPCCDFCWVHKIMGICISGGPFEGYVKIDADYNEVSAPSERVLLDYNEVKTDDE